MKTSDMIRMFPHITFEHGSFIITTHDIADALQRQAKKIETLTARYEDSDRACREWKKLHNVNVAQMREDTNEIVSLKVQLQELNRQGQNHRELKDKLENEVKHLRAANNQLTKELALLKKDHANLQHGYTAVRENNNTLVQMNSQYRVENKRLQLHAVSFETAENLAKRNDDLQTELLGAKQQIHDFEKTRVDLAHRAADLKKVCDRVPAGWCPWDYLDHLTSIEKQYTVFKKNVRAKGYKIALGIDDLQPFLEKLAKVYGGTFKEKIEGLLATNEATKIKLDHYDEIKKRLGADPIRRMEDVLSFQERLFDLTRSSSRAEVLSEVEHLIKGGRALRSALLRQGIRTDMKLDDLVKTIIKDLNELEALKRHGFFNKEFLDTLCDLLKPFGDEKITDRVARLVAIVDEVAKTLGSTDVNNIPRDLRHRERLLQDTDPLVIYDSIWPASGLCTAAKIKTVKGILSYDPQVGELKKQIRACFRFLQSSVEIPETVPELKKLLAELKEKMK